MIRRPVTCAAFIGRHDELAALDDARRALARSRGGIVLIGGEAGLGKTRLLAQFAKNCGDGRARYLAAGECLERAPQPYGPIRAALATLSASVSRDEIPPAAARALAQLVPDFAAPSAGENGDGPLEKAELLAGAVTFLKWLADKRATIVTIEDVHWADASTLDFLTYVASRMAGTRLLFVATYRSDEIDGNDTLVSAMSRLLRESSVRRLMLESFAPDDLRALIVGALEGHAPLDEPTRRDVERRSEGNPFFAEELLKSALEQRGAHESSSLPFSIRASILERIAELGDDDRRVLVHAAVLGYRFDPAVLALVMRRDVDDIVPTLRRARDLNIVVEEVGERIWCRFRHALTRQTIYEDMLAFDRRRLHDQILRTLEGLADRERHLEELAFHAWEAKDAVRALDYNERAGDAAMKLRAIGEAAACFERAFAVAVGDDDRARLLERIGTTAQSQGRFQRSIDAFEAAFALRVRREEFEDAARIVVWIVGDRSNSGDDSGIAFGERFLAEHGDRLSASARGAALALLARLASARYDFEAVRAYLARIDDRAALAPRARQNCDIADLNRFSFVGDRAQWRRVALGLRAIVPELPPFLQVIALYTIGQTGTYLGDNDVVERAFAEARRVQHLWNFSGIDIFGSAVRASYEFLRGRLDEARACVAESLDRSEVAVARSILAQVGPPLALALGDDALAERCSDASAIADARANPADPDDAVILGARATWLVRSGRLAEARGDLRKAVRAMTWAAPHAVGLLCAAARYLELSELGPVVALAETSAAEHVEGACVAMNLLVRAIVATREGRPADAELAARAAARACAALEWPLFEAQAYELAGDADAARALYERCGAKGLFATPVGAGPSDESLSAREREVAELVTLGLTNTSIAERLSVSKKTVEKHLSSIFAKLGIRSRAQIVAYVVREESARARA